MLVGGYTLDVYCDVPNCRGIDQGYAQTAWQCQRQLRQKGWVLNTHKGVAYCPSHADKSTRGETLK